jgi:hypothetical protein
LIVDLETYYDELNTTKIIQMSSVLFLNEEKVFFNGFVQFNNDIDPNLNDFNVIKSNNNLSEIVDQVVFKFFINNNNLNDVIKSEYKDESELFLNFIYFLKQFKKEIFLVSFNGKSFDNRILLNLGIKSFDLNLFLVDAYTLTTKISVEKLLKIYKLNRLHQHDGLKDSIDESLILKKFLESIIDPKDIEGKLN